MRGTSISVSVFLGEGDRGHQSEITEAGLVDKDEATTPTEVLPDLPRLSVCGKGIAVDPVGRTEHDVDPPHVGEPSFGIAAELGIGVCDATEVLLHCLVRRRPGRGVPLLPELGIESALILERAGILDPVETRQSLALGLSAAFNAPVPKAQFGVFRM